MLPKLRKCLCGGKPEYVEVMFFTNGRVDDREAHAVKCFKCWRSTPNVMGGDHKRIIAAQIWNKPRCTRKKLSGHVGF
jgi:hypothetical protein